MSLYRHLHSFPIAMFDCRRVAAEVQDSTSISLFL